MNPKLTSDVDMSVANGESDHTVVENNSTQVQPHENVGPTRKSWRKGRVKMTQTILTRAQTLQDFAYRSADLAAELGLHNTEIWRVREWCRRGLPHQHNPTGHVLINGRVFLGWAESMVKPRVRKKLPPGHMWCPGCNAPQPMQNPSFDTVHGRLRRTAQCPHGHSMSQWYSRRHG